MKNKDYISLWHSNADRAKKDELLLLATAVDLLEEIRDLLRNELRDRKDDGK